MKTKNWFLLSGLLLCGLVWNGCYTQLARPDQEEDTQVASESEATDEESERASCEREYDDGQDDDRDVTQVYVFSDGWYRPYWYYPSWYRYPRSRFYVSVGFGYYDPFDPWGWCGTRWSWYDPWDYYYGGYWGYRDRGWRSYYYPHYYSPRYAYRDRVVEGTRRPSARRGLVSTPNNQPTTYVTSGRGSLLRPTAGTYARGNDGSYRRVLKNEPAERSERDRASRGSDGRRTVVRRSGNDHDSGRTVISRGGSSGDSERRARKPESGSDGGSKRRGSSGSGGSVSKPSGSSGHGAAHGSGSGSSSNRRPRKQ
jgi:hypothetical protein